tara:strand:+ start:193 stop:858 length:666 start_codon:yes stop_codon:yes gene_type:complete
MIDKRLMYAQGRRVGFEPGGMAGEHGMGAGVGADGKTDGQRDGGNNGGYRGPTELGVTTRDVNKISMDPVDRSAVNQFSTYGKNVMNQNLQGPSVFSQIGTGIGNYIKGGGLIGMGIRGLTNLFGGPTTKDTTAPDQRNMFNVSGPVVGPDFGDGDGDGQGIMNLYNPNMLNVSGKVEEEVPVSKEEEDFKQRYRVANEFRQDKQGQLDPAILEMISKLYT